MRTNPDLAWVREVFDYDPAGYLRWRTTTKHHRAGTIAGHKLPNGKVKISHNYKKYLMHRLIWAWHHGEYPPLLDHKDCDGGHSRVENLRPASPLLNAHNTKKVRGKIPYAGVRKLGNKYEARIRYNWKRKTIGYFDTPEEASEAYQKEKAKILAQLER